MKMNSKLYSTIVVSKAPHCQLLENVCEGLDQQLRKTTDNIFMRLCSQDITEDQMKIQFSKQLLALVLGTLPQKYINDSSVSISPQYFKNIQELIKENMAFLRTVYPKMKGLKGKNNNFMQNFQDIDESDKVEFDFLINMGINFEAQKQQKYGKGNYVNNDDDDINDRPSKKVERAYILEQVETLLNKIIISAQETIPKFNNLIKSGIANQLPRKIRKEYQQTLKDPRRFQIDTLLNNDTKLFNKQLIHQNLVIDSFGLFEVVEKWANDLGDMLGNSEKYLANRKFLKIISGSSRRKQLSQIKSMKIFGRKSNVSRSTLDQSKWDINLFGELPQNQVIEEENENEGSQKKQGFWNYIFGGLKQLCNNRNQLQGFDGIDEKSKKKYVDRRSAALWGENRHLRKKVAVIEGQMQKINQNRKKYENYDFRASGFPIASYTQSFSEIGENKNYFRFVEKQASQLQQCYSQSLKIVNKNKLRQRYTESQKKIYSFSQNSYDFIQQMLIQKLILLISAIIEYRDNYKQQQSSNLSALKDIQLFSMKLKEMMSCSLVGDESFVTSIYKCMMELHTSRQISIMKIQNRLDSSNQDILVEFTIAGNPITCALKLILEYKQAATQTKQAASQMLYNLFDQIQSSSYGPLSHLSLILATMDHRIQYLSQIRKAQVFTNIPLNRLCHCNKGIVAEDSSYLIFDNQIQKLITQNNTIDLNVYRNMLESQFVCGICQKAIKKGMNVLPVQKCSECGFAICVNCAYQIYPEHQLKTYLKLLNSVVRINHPQYQANLILQDLRKMEYSHSYRKEVQKVNYTNIQKQIQNTFDIVIEGRNIVKFEPKDTVEDFWKRVREKIELKKLPNYQNIIKKQIYAGIILRPRELLRKKGTPFLFIHYNGLKKRFSKFSYRPGDLEPNVTHINELQLELQENDMFFPILWLQGEQLIPDYISKVLETNPFCKKTSKKQSPIYQKIKSISANETPMYPTYSQRDSSDPGQADSMMRKSTRKTKISRPRYSANRLVR